MKKIICFLAIIIAGSSIRAQIKGTVIDSATQKPIDRAIVGLVVKSDEADTTYTFTDEKGQFTISPVPSASFSLIFSTVNYQPLAKFIPVTQPVKTINAGIITLAERAKLLDEVTVISSPIVIKEDTIEYRADAFKVKENAMTEDLLKKLPGITVDKDGNVKAQGKDVTKVRVNGKDFFGGDVKTATRELPANIIDKVQVIDDYGDQATVSGIKEGDPEKIINLQIKKDKNRGFFGRATVGAGKEDRYQASFNGNYFNNQQQISLFANSNNTNQSLFNFGSMGANRGMGSMMKMGQSMMNDMGGTSGLMNAMQNGDQSFIGGSQNSNAGITTSNSVGINFRDQWGKKLGVYGSYSFSHRNNAALQYTSAQNFFQDGSFINNQENNSLTRGDNHRFFFNLEYQADSLNYLKISPSVSYASNNSDSKTKFDYFETNGIKTTDGLNNNLSHSTTPNISANILFNHKFRKRGRNFSANLNLGNSASNSDQDTKNITNTYVNPATIINRFQFIDQQNDNHNYGIRLTFSEPISSIRSLDIAASHSLNYARNDKKTYDVDPVTGNQSFLSFLSNDYENNFYNNRVGISLRTTLKKYNYTLGISMQPVSQQGNSITKDSVYRPVNRVNIFPIARFAYNFSKSKTLNINYSGNASQPSFSQLQDVLDISNQQSVTKGNPNLKPAINHNVNVSFNNFNFVTGKVIFANITLSTIRNQIVNNTINRGNTGAQLSIPENVNGYYNAMGFYTYSRPYKNRKYILTLSGNINFNHNVNLVDSIRNIGQNIIASQGINVEYNYKTWLQLGMGASYRLNDVKYKNPAGKQVSLLRNTSSNAWTLNSNISIDIPKNWVLLYDFDYVINNGLSNSVSRNIAILNASIEKQLFKKKNGIVKLSAYDIFNQNTNISRTVNANAITDTRTNRLARFFMLTFTYRIQKFKGQQPQPQGFRAMGVPPKNAEIKVF
ncbi:MAG: outer membrane beta-barrel protein [Ferruginibacter sp.]|nr:outer membrane beta-barrel protein [Ferruginibacter sp.]